MRLCCRGACPIPFLNLPQEEDDDDKQPTLSRDEQEELSDAWSTRTLNVLAICTDAMHATPLAKQFLCAAQQSRRYPELELRIHNVRSAALL